MALHLVKLCVGAESIGDLEDWILMRVDEARRTKQPVEHRHTTRMVPKRIEDLVDGGSLYWVIKGQIAARQELLEVRPFTDEGGVSRCHLVLEPTVVPVSPRPCRPFQGWRYLPSDSAPPDLDQAGQGLDRFPEPLRRELSELGLL
jgi:hypothetical protein